MRVRHFFAALTASALVSLALACGSSDPEPARCYGGGYVGCTIIVQCSDGDHRLECKSQTPGSTCTCTTDKVVEKEVPFDPAGCPSGTSSDRNALMNRAIDVCGWNVERR